MKGVPEAEHIPPTLPSGPSQVCFLGNKRSQEEGRGAVKTRRGSHEWELGNFPASTWAVAAAWIKKTPKTSFLSLLPLFLQADRRLEQLIWADKHQTRSFHGNPKLPPQPWILFKSPRPLFKASVRFLRSHPQSSPRSQPSPHPLHALLKGHGNGGELHW